MKTSNGTNRTLIFFLVAFFVLVPAFVLATAPSLTKEYKEALVPCGTDDVVNNDTGAAGADGKVDVNNRCGFNHVIELAKRIITAWIMVGVTVAALGFAYAGFLYITAMGSDEKIKHAHSIFIKTFWGFVFMLSAWLIVKVFEDTFLTTTQKEKSYLISCGVNEKLVDGKCVEK